MGGPRISPGYGPVQDDVAAVFHHWHSRSRVYPQDVQVVPRLTAQAVADTFGAWTEIIPINTVPFLFMIRGFVIEEVSAATTYYVQLGYNIIVADPGANMELGERRVRLVTVPVTRATELLDVSGRAVPANARIMGRVKTATGVADWCDVSVVIIRHVMVNRPVDPYGAFPW